jgi:hypothetical protein
VAGEVAAAEEEGTGALGLVASPPAAAVAATASAAAAASRLRRVRSAARP